jgi:hypothetical protein
MNRSPRTILLALPFAALALAAAGCGGSEVGAEEVPGSPPALVVPSDSELGAGGSNADASSEASADESAAGDAEAGADSGTTDSGTGGSAAPAAPAEPSGGTEAPETAAPEPTQPPAGSAPEQFENFCEQNAGAC